MDSRFFYSFLLVSAVLLSGCVEPDNSSGYYTMREDGQEHYSDGMFDDPNRTYYDTGDDQYDSYDSGSDYAADEDCGYYEGPCCTYMGTDAFGSFTAYNYCKDGLECRADTCVEGPEYTAYDPRTHSYPD